MWLYLGSIISVKVTMSLQDSVDLIIASGTNQPKTPVIPTADCRLEDTLGDSVGNHGQAVQQ